MNVTQMIWQICNINAADDAIPQRAEARGRTGHTIELDWIVVGKRDGGRIETHHQSAIVSIVNKAAKKVVLEELEVEWEVCSVG